MRYGRKKGKSSAFQWLGRHDLNAKTAQPHVSVLAGSEQTDRRNPQVPENLRTETDLAPLLRTGGVSAAVALVRNLATGTPAVPSRKR
jgi:hypothetical protein